MSIQMASGKAPIGVQRRMMEVGRIRFGDVVSGRGSRPRALDKFRLTSASREVLEAAAAVYGAAKPVREWKDAPNPGTFELYTDSHELDVVLPPVQSALDGSATYPYSQAWELWDGPTCARRCDGELVVVPSRGQLLEKPCICGDARGTGEAFCEIRTRISVMLPRLPGIGLWRMDTGGMYAAAYLPGTLQLLAMAAARGRYLPCKLRLEHRSSKRPNAKGDIETHRFVVPVLDPGITPGELMALTGPEAVNVPQIGNGEKPLLPEPAERPEAVLEKESASLGAPPPLPSAAPLVAPNEQPGEGERGIAGRDPDPATTPSSAGDKWLATIHAIGREKGLDHDGIRLVAAGFFGEAVFPADRSLTDLNPLERGQLRKALDDMKPSPPPQQVTEDPDPTPDSEADAPSPAAAAAPPSGVAAESGPFADSPPAKVAPTPTSDKPDTADPDPAIEAALWGAAVAHGLIPADAGVAGWDVIDALAERVFKKDRGIVLRSELTELAAQIAAGTHDPAPARPRRATSKEST